MILLSKRNLLFVKSISFREKFFKYEVDAVSKGFVMDCLLVHLRMFLH